MKKYTGFMIVLAFIFSMSLVSGANAGDKAAGEAYAKKKCKACHNVAPCTGDAKAQKKPGANFTGIKARGADLVWLKSWLGNQKKTWKAGGGYMDTLKARLHMQDKKKGKMFVKFKKPEDLDNVAAYLMSLDFDEKCNGKIDVKNGFKGK